MKISLNNNFKKTTTSLPHTVDVYKVTCTEKSTFCTLQPQTHNFSIQTGMVNSKHPFSLFLFPLSVTLRSLTVSIKCCVCVKRAALVLLPALLRGSELCERTLLRKQGVTVNTIRTANSVWFGFLDANIQRTVLL